MAASTQRNPVDFRRAFLTSIAGAVVTQPWYDRFGLWTVTQVIKPLSRAWAAALETRGDVHAFCHQFPAAKPNRTTKRMLDGLMRNAKAYEAAIAAWDEAMFGERPGDPDPKVERQRERTASRLMTDRGRFLPLLAAGGLEPMRWEVASPSAVQAVHGWRLDNPADAFQPVDPAPPVRVSKALNTSDGSLQWLRFDDGVEGDLWARINLPRDGEPRGAVVMAHSLALEIEMWPGIAAPLPEFTNAGYAFIQPTGPWHGRRRPTGWYGGEPIMGRGPMGMLDYLHRHVRELGRLIAWARTLTNGPVGLAGVSLGSLNSALVATAARHWPAEMRPDALLLVTGTDDMVSATFDGTLSRSIGAPAALRRAGWDAKGIRRWSPLLEPQGDPVMGADRVVVALGRHDDVLPFDTGLRLAKSWGVPERNLHIRPQGHFTVSLGMVSSPEPLVQLVQLLDAQAGVRAA